MLQDSSTRRMKIGLTLTTTEGSLDGQTPTFSDLQTMAQLAEQVGFDSLWLADHLLLRFPGQDDYTTLEVLSVLSALAAVTSRLHLGPLVASTSFRAPALLAKMAETINDISNGRFILGVGAGWHQAEYEAFGYPFDHLVDRFEEALYITQSLLRNGHLDFQGRYYQVQHCVLRHRDPSHAGPPLWVGGQRPRMLRLAAQYADAWNTAWHVEPAVVQQKYEEFQQVCIEVGRDPSTIELTAGVVICPLAPSEGQSAPADQVITGSPEYIAHQLQHFALLGTSHLIVSLKPLSFAGIEQFGHIMQLLRE